MTLKASVNKKKDVFTVSFIIHKKKLPLLNLTRKCSIKEN